MDRSTVNKLQHQYWVTKQTVYRKLGKKEDECIIASDSELDSKLELFKSIQQTSVAMNKLLDRYQERICYLAQEQNAMGRFLKEYGKADKSAAGKMMIQMGKSLIYCSQQEIALRPPLLRLYQEVETFRNRAVDDTLITIHQMEKNRTEYRASLNWMKKVSQELDPDTYKQMDKFRKVQNHVKSSKSLFDKLKLACLQKVDLLAAARCNMFSHALIQYLQATTKVTAKNEKIFNTLAITFKGHQHFDFSVVKELAEPSKKLAEECGTKPLTDELLFDFNDEVDGKNKEVSATLDSSAKVKNETSKLTKKENEADLLNLANASEILDNLLGPLDQSPEAENAQDVLDLGLHLGSKSFDSDKETGSKSLVNLGSFMNKNQKKEKDTSSKDVMDLLSSEEFEGFTFETESDTMTLLNEILNASNPPEIGSGDTLMNLSLDSGPGSSFKATQHNLSSAPSSNVSQLQQSLSSSSFMPSYLLDLANLGLANSDADLLSLSENPSTNPKERKIDTAPEAKTWYDIFSDLDPLGNPDAIGDKEKDAKETENRYC